jgi:hypothetical protein
MCPAQVNDEFEVTINETNVTAVHREHKHKYFFPRMRSNWYYDRCNVRMFKYGKEFFASHGRNRRSVLQPLPGTVWIQWLLKYTVVEPSGFATAAGDG